MDSFQLDSLAQLFQGLQEEELAARLKVTPQVLQKAKTQTDFEQWSQQRDPEKLSWSYRQNTQRYFVNLSLGGN